MRLGDEHAVERVMMFSGQFSGMSRRAFNLSYPTVPVDLESTDPTHRV
jgi:hypothetical protein